MANLVMLCTGLCGAVWMHVGGFVALANGFYTVLSVSKVFCSCLAFICTCSRVISKKNQSSYKCTFTLKGKLLV